MLKIKNIKIEINTNEGLFGAEHQFGTGLNIIRGDNTTGKSTLFQSIIYALGFEELLGGKFEKTLQSVLKDQVEYPRNSKYHNIIQSYIFLVIENQNNEIITIRRGVKTVNRKSQLIDVYFGNYIENADVISEQKQMWVHDSGGASNKVFGFHKFLSDFLNMELPKVITYKGDYAKLYLQQIASSFIIEQKKGWSDYFITAPFYSIRDLNQRIVEFILHLDVFENNETKEAINFRKNKLKNNWQKAYNDLFYLADRSSTELIGISEEPEIINNLTTVKLVYKKEEKSLKIEEYLSELEEELSTYRQETNTVGENVNHFELLLKEKQELLNKVVLNYDILLPTIINEESKLNQYEKQYEAIADDLQKNKGVLKLNQLGAKSDIKITRDICPTCLQDLKDLLPMDIDHTPMRLEDNVKYLESQLRMIEMFISGQRKLISDQNDLSEKYRQNSSVLRQEIRALKAELLEDERIPSIIEIEKKFSLTQKVNFYRKTIDRFEASKQSLEILIQEYVSIQTELSKLPKLHLSQKDSSKLKELENNFINYLKEFKYTSKAFESIKISRDNYFPIVDQLYSIKFDSSASDYIRSIWSYTISLMKTSVKFEANHPQLLIFDEPKQQDVSLETFKIFLKELSKFTEQQVLVFASFEDSDETFFESTRDIQFKLNKIEETLIKPINSKLS